MAVAVKTFNALWRSPIAWCVAAVVLGLCAGVVLGKNAAVLGVVAWLPLSIMRGLATPLLFLAIVSGLMNRELTGRGARSLVMICLLNACAAVTLALLLVHVFRPGDAMTPLLAGIAADSSSGSKVTWLDAIKGLVPESIAGPFVTNNIPAVLILALLAGFSLRHAASVQNGSGAFQGHMEPWYFSVRDGLQRGLQIVIGMMQIVLTLMPLAIFAAVAKAVGEHGLAVFHGLGRYVLICIGGMVLQIVMVYHSWIVFWAKRRLRDFWHVAKLPFVYAFGVNSSLATLPTTLSALDQLGVRTEASRLGACVGTNFNNDGILLYEVAAVMMLAQAAGFDWSVGHQLAVAGVCVLATLGVSGFPEAGVIALTLVLNSAGLPIEILPLLLPVDWLVARMRSATNVISDMTVSVALNASVSSASERSLD